MADAFRWPFKRPVNYLGAYRIDRGKQSLPVLEDMQFESAGGASQIVGALSFAFTTTGGVTTKAALSCSQVLTFSTIGSLSSRISIGGTSAIAFTVLGSLYGQSRTAGATFPSFILTGTLLGKSALSGNTAFVFSAAAAVNATGGSSGTVKVFNGNSFVAKPIKVWTGSVWAVKPVKRFNGTAWV